MSPDSKPFPIYQLQDAFEAFCNSEPAAKPQHRSLYYFLLGYCRRRGNAPRFNLAYEAGMHGSGIGSWATYDATLKALAEWGFILYTPGANRYKVPVVELTFRNPTDDVLLTYWQSYCLSTANPTDDVLLTQLATLKEELKKEKEKVAKLESREPLPSVEGAASSTGELEKKIEEVEQPSQSPTPGLRTPGGRADVGTRKPAFVPPTYEQMLSYMVSQRPHTPPPDVERVAAKCFGYYSGNGWKVGKNPMKDWKGACQTFLADLPKLKAAPILPPQQQYSGGFRPQPVSQVDHRQTVIEQARAMLHNQPTG